MQTSVKQDQIILCSKHGQEVVQIVLDPNYLIDDRMLCLQCIKTTRQPYKSVIGIDSAIEMINERIIQQNTQIEEKIHPYINKLTNLQQKLLKLRETLINTIDNIIEFMQKWISEMNGSINKTDSIELKKGLEMLQQDNQETIQQLEKNGKAYIIKLSLSFKKLLKMEGIQQCKQELINLPLSNQQIQQQNVKIQTRKKIQQQSIQDVNKKQGKITYELVNQVKQGYYCQAIAFNNTGTIMVAGFQGDIKVWQFNAGKIDELTQFKGQSDYISCLIFSKINQFFVSGDWHGQIQLFKQGISNKEWLQSNIQKQHTDQINCIILNSKEDQLISCSFDQTIKVWQVNYSSNKLEYSYTLEKKHTEEVYGLSLNESNTLLISCGRDEQIILWIKGTDDKWKFKNSVEMNCWILRICFINDNEFVVQQWGQGYSNIFKIEDYQLKEQENLKIQLTDKNGDDCDQFPTIYNKKKDVIILKSSKFVYIIRREINGQFKVQAQPIDCETKYNYGSMTENGQHLAIWNSETSELRIYKLNYE